MNLLPKYENHLQKLQINLEELYLENQNYANSFFELKSEIKSLKEELSHILINNSLFDQDLSRNSNTSGSNEQLSNFFIKKKNLRKFLDERIQKIIKIIEIIEKYTDKFSQNTEHHSTHYTQFDEEMPFSSKRLITEEQGNPKSTTSEENHTGKSENLSAQLPKRLSRFPSKLFHMLHQSKKNKFNLEFSSKNYLKKKKEKKRSS